MSNSEKYIYTFKEGNKEMKNILGGKGANLSEMTNLGLAIPQGFTISCQACLDYFDNPEEFIEKIKPGVMEHIKIMESESGKTFGANINALLVSIRSGAPMSMPGMMDTVLNLGLNDEAVAGLARETKNERFAQDAYRRFIQMFGDVVMGVELENFESILNNHKKAKGKDSLIDKVSKKYIEESDIQDTDLTVGDLKNIIEEYKVMYKKGIGDDFPQDPIEQLFLAIRAVFDSWNTPRAKIYRKINKIPNFGTAVNIQCMVFGNKGWDSGTGVAFTRDPSTGEKIKFGEYLANAQGEDVVAGIRTPKKLEEMKEEFPAVYKELMETMENLEKHYKDMQDIEFTIEKGKLYILQTRNGKRTPQAAIRIAVERFEEKLITKEEAIMAIDPSIFSNLLFKSIKENAFTSENLLGQGLNASPGAVCGEVVFDADTAVELTEKGKNIILVRPQTKPDDVHGLFAAKGVLTQFGGKTSHAAVVARGMGKPAVVGAQKFEVDVEHKKFQVGTKVIGEGDWITIDGSTGKCFEGKMDLIEPKLKDEFLKLLSWADEIRKLGVRANADTPTDAEKAIEFGAEGIGLCRTEHMFMAQERLPVVQEMIMADSKRIRQKALDKILPMQKGDFYEIFKIMKDKPVTIRLLDPPLHEFLPELHTVLMEAHELKNSLKNSLDKESINKEIEKKNSVINKIRSLSEENPMMGLRGCRLGITWPEINEMQVKAIFQAACELKKEGINAVVEVMIPLIGMVSELKHVKDDLVRIAAETIESYGVKLDYKFGTMIEIPRAALVSEEIAKEAEFFSFGTNDLTQMTFGYSRDDAEGKFISVYLEEGILRDNPFETLDQVGVGRLMKLSISEGRKSRPDLKCGICGEHGGEPSSIIFSHDIGLDYVSCSPFRIPIARLTAAQAVILEKQKK